jgi:hypothetical protein
MKHIVPARLFDKLDGWLRGPWTKDTPSDDSLYDAEVVFKTGVRLLIQVVGCSEETPYVQVVALDKEGNEIGNNSDTSDTGFGGRYQVGVKCANGSVRQYTVDVARAKPKARQCVYMGVSIDRISHSGMWRALVKGKYRKADTLGGIKTLIKESLT